MDTDGIHCERDAELEKSLKEFRASALAAVERPESFWTAQRRAVLERMGRPRKTLAWRPALVWGTALAFILVVAAIWLDGPRALPAPDFAAGYDQDLLLEVERLTEAQTSLALEPAQLLAREIAEGIATHKAP